MDSQHAKNGPDKGLQIIIIGAGLGGLAAALSIKGAAPWHHVQVLESAAELTEVGAGLQLTPNSTKLFDRWGIRQSLEPLVTSPKEFVIYRYRDGAVLGKRNDYGKEMFEKYRGNFWDVHRADLQLAMFDRARSLGVKFQFKATVVDYALSQSKVTLANGEEFTGDLIVAADGLWSRCRSHFLGRHDPPIPTGDLAYRITLIRDQIQDKDLQDFMSDPKVCLWAGPQSHVIYYPLRNNTMANIVLLVPDNLPSDVARSPGDLSEMHDIFCDWDPRLRRFLALVPKVEKWKLMHLPEMENWYNPEASVVFLGDSCHPMLPYMAQGANSALEDGATLGIVLSKAVEKKDLPRALKIYQDLRKPRSSMLQKGSMHQRYFNHLPDGPEQVERDRLAVEQFDEPQPGYPFYWLDPERQSRVYGYDVVEELGKVGILSGHKL